MRAKRYVQMSDDCLMELQRAHKTVCCDCGLVHLWELQERKGSGKFFFRIRRDNRATAQMRKNHNYDFKKAIE